MIEEIRLKNFQSHRDSVLRLHPGVNVIVGPTDCGKTAVLRALNWVVNNRPMGTRFRSRWGGDTEVTVDLSGGTYVTRRRTKKDNLYEILPGNGRTEVLKALKSEVPEEILTELNMDEINVQRQHDQPFLLSAGSAEVARVLNRIANLEEIETAQKTANSRVRNLMARETAAEEEKRVLAGRLEEFDDLEDQESLLHSIEEAQKNIYQDQEWYDEVKETVLQARLEKKKVDEIETFLKDVGPWTAASLRNYEALKKSSGELEDLRELVRRVWDLQEFAEGHEWLEEAEPKVLDGQVRLRGVRKKAEDRARLAAEIDKAEQFRKKVDEMGRKGEEAEKEFRKVMPDECPLCGRSG